MSHDTFPRTGKKAPTQTNFYASLAISYSALGVKTNLQTSPRLALRPARDFPGFARLSRPSLGPGVRACPHVFEAFLEGRTLEIPQAVFANGPDK